MARVLRWRNVNLGGKAFIGLVILAGTGVLLYGSMRASSVNIAEFICYLLIALLASQLRVSLPALADTLSVNFLFVLVGILDLSFAETLMLGCVGALVQSFDGERLRPVRITFNICCSAVAIGLSYGFYHGAPVFLGHLAIQSILLGVAASIYFLVNTVSTAAMVSLSEKRSFKRIWGESYRWSFPYYLGGAALADVLAWLNRNFQWESSLLALPLVYAIYRSYRLYVGKLDDEKRHIEEMADLHMRTIEALALAIEAKDHTTHDHLQRVRMYALEVAKEIGLSAAELEALQAAALVARHRKAGRSRTHHFEARPADAGRIREDENSSCGRGGNSGARALSLPSGADRTRPPREVGWFGLSLRPETGRDPGWRAHSFARSITWTRLPRTASIARRCRWKR